MNIIATNIVKALSYMQSHILHIEKKKNQKKGPRIFEF